MSPTERIFPAAPLSTAGGRVIVSPFQFVLTGEDNLRLTMWTLLDSVTVTVQGRRLDVDGVVNVFAFNVTSGVLPQAVTRDYPLGRGAILNLTTFVTSPTVEYGQVFVRLELVRGFSGGTMVLGTLLQGYISTETRLAWPGSPLQSNREGPGRTRAVVDSNGVAPGNQLNIAPDAGTLWEIRSFAANLVTNATAVTRTVFLDLYHGSDFVFRMPCAYSQAASLSRFWCWGHDLPYPTNVDTAVGTAGLLDLPAIDNTWSVRTTVVNFQGADQWAYSALVVREFLSLAF